MFKLLVVVSFYLAKSWLIEATVSDKRYTHHRDVSEYCRRRALPSVFLGRHVLNANSQVLHFSRLELPYSCSISVRAESGSNIILVVQYVSANTLLRSCTEDNHQLIVYEIGETFGGYWGPLPDSIMRQEMKNFTQFYTLHTTKPTTTVDSSSDSYDEYEAETTTVTSTTTERKLVKGSDYIEIELPLVNVSGNIPLNRLDDVEEVLELINDITPREGADYDTSILPLLQFSMVTSKDSTLSEFNKDKLKFASKYYTGFYTPDPRLNYETINQRKQRLPHRYNSFSNRRLNFKKRLPTLFSKAISTTYRRQVNPYIFPRTEEDEISLYFTNSMSSPHEARETISKPQEIIDDILKSLSHTTESYQSQNYLIQRMLDSQQNSSELKRLSHQIKATDAYNDSSIKSTEITFKNKTTNFFTDNQTDSYFTNIASLNVSEDKISNNVIYTYPIEDPEPVTHSMVKHESWDNVVRAAPVMAVLLNQTLPPDIYANINNQDKVNETVKVGKTRDIQISRKKRHIQPLEIKNAIPRVMTTARNSFTTKKNVEEFVDVQDISHLVELKDDEIHGRVALRYMRSYVGSTLFNICDTRDAKARHVYLFNTSRIVIAISNYTMKKMTLVMTPARVLKSKEISCPAAHVECQVSGARVCIDSMSACDGVPNCGAYDIYDEDRLLCGVVSNLYHNVYLAAGTFLAVLLTLLYTVHYWLKRCVPGVSEAFFIYTDRSENILNLETIMQSPNEDDLGSKMVYGAHFFYDDTLDMYNDKTKETVFKKMWRFCISCCPKRHSKKKDIKDEISSHGSDTNQPPVKRLFSFAELELSKISPKMYYDANVQTGESLEIDHLQTHNLDNNLVLNTDKNKKNRKEIEELNILKFLKESKSESIQSFPKTETYKSVDNDDKNLYFNNTIHEKRELSSTVYEPHSSKSQKHEHVKVVTRCDIHSDKVEPSLLKRLRFDEEATTIPSTHTDEEILEGEEQSSTQVVLGTEKLRRSDDIEEQESGSGREFMRFWTSAKDKKAKKRKRIVLH
ncbi:PREDICTED: uncharacterized protein LOC106117521 isoform X2 [Papilio xuthus]|uniref:Uncharacterized protein LOC106117521 isoform X2 n=1 Tax=Papilio xuthus TaxID=66420 RepID=A0AAJ6Z8H5_PAPXU|nr:PREDICTED: uncharacterized protein LOC106117521 isoform X2 [Papilio xuthus]